MVMRGVDVYSDDGQDILSKINYDFSIIKMSGNPKGHKGNYVNPYAEKQAKDAGEKTGRIGFYHFTGGKDDPREEADFFVEQVKKLGYLRKAILGIDYEGPALEKGAEWVAAMAERIREKAGYAPGIYASGSTIIEQNLFSLGYPIGCANYSKKYTRIDDYDTEGCTIYPGCEDAIMGQFTRTGYVNDIGELDCNIFYGKEIDGQKLAGAYESHLRAVAQEVINGFGGNGEERVLQLTAAGYDYQTVQNIVNSILLAENESTSTEDPDPIESTPIEESISTEENAPIQESNPMEENTPSEEKKEPEPIEDFLPTEDAPLPQPEEIQSFAQKIKNMFKNFFTSFIKKLKKIF